nr:tyrosine decarboxylase 1-like [Ipomoea batatas]
MKDNPELFSPLDVEEFRRQGHMVVDFVADYYQGIEKFPVRSKVEPGYLRQLLPESPPDNAEPLENILHDIQRDITPGITHWQSPNFFAYFPSSGSTAGFLGEMLCAGFNVVGFSWITSPAATELESIVMDWFAKLLNLPTSFHFSGGGGGVLQGTTCEAMLCTLTAARDQILRKIGRDNIGKLVVYASDQTHFSLQKAAKIAGLNPENFRAIPTTKATEYAISPENLRLAILKDVGRGLVPLYFCATIGTTMTNAVDPLRPICNVAKQFDMWVHVDAAYAGSACICPEFQDHLDGIEDANYFSLNAHKWFFTTLDCCCLWVRDPAPLIASLSTNHECLRNQATDSKTVVDYKDWQIALSRRFRALKLWLVMRSYGTANLRGFIRSHVGMAKHFQGLVGMDKRFEVVAPTNFGLVCFRVSPSALLLMEEEEEEERVNEFNTELLESINSSGELFMTHGVVGGIYFLRFAVGASLTHCNHVHSAWNLIQRHANAKLIKCSILPARDI